MIHRTPDPIASAAALRAECDALRAEVARPRPLTALSVEQCIDMARAALARLGIPERNVKVTWDTDADWARFRAKLPSGRVVDRTERVVQPFAGARYERVGRGENATARASDVALTTLARWLRDVARARPADLDAAFAEHLVAVGGAK